MHLYKLLFAVPPVVQCLGWLPRTVFPYKHLHLVDQPLSLPLTPFLGPSPLVPLSATPTRSNMRPVAIACLAPLAAATKNIVGLSYADAIPKEALAQDCEYPAYFTIQGFTTFTPSASNTTEIDFGCTFRAESYDA